MIEPTVWRVVWFRAHQNDEDLGGFDRSRPMAAIVAYVHGPRAVNLVVFDPNGNPWPRASVPLMQAEDAFPPAVGVSYCEWMPYQIGQAKKHDASPTGIVAADPLTG